MQPCFNRAAVSLLAQLRASRTNSVLSFKRTDRYKAAVLIDNPIDVYVTFRLLKVKNIIN